MKELIEAITRAANAIAAYYEKEGNPVGTAVARIVATAPEKPLSEDVPAPKKARAKKETTTVETPATADVGFDALAPAKVAKKSGMTDEESAKAVTDTAKLLVAKFNKPQADGKPEGFHIAKRLLIEDFKVGRLSDLSHEQRIEFVKQVKEILTKEPAGV